MKNPPQISIFGRLLPIVFFVSLTSLLAFGQEPQKQNTKKEKERIIAIGDVHGDYTTFRSLLSSPNVGLIDEKGHWIGGSTHLVMTGDLLDRGARGFDIIEHLMLLEIQAPRAKGKVTVLLGNHEVMNLSMDWSSVWKPEYELFAKDEKEQFRKEKLAELKAFYYAQHLGVTEGYYRETLSRIVRSHLQESEPRFLERFFDELFKDPDAARRTLKQKIESLVDAVLEEKYPKGFFSRAERLLPGGDIGDWLSAKPGIFKAGDSLFMHGGLNQRWGKVPYLKIQTQMHKDIKDYLSITEELHASGNFHRIFGAQGLEDLINAESKRDPREKHLSAVSRHTARVLEIFNGPCFTNDGPLWYRGLAQGGFGVEEELDAILKAQDIKRVVIGHTVTLSKKIEPRFEGRVWSIDVGMNQQAYRGNPEALEIIDGEVTRILPLKGEPREALPKEKDIELLKEKKDKNETNEPR